MKTSGSIAYLVLALVLSITSVPMGYSATAKLGFSSEQSVYKGATLTVNITVSDVVNLNSVNIAVSFDSGILSCTDLGGWTASDSMFAGYSITSLGSDIDNTLGTVTATAGLDYGVGVSGSGKLCTIQFQAISIGAARLAFKNVMKMQQHSTYLRDTSDSMIPLDASLGVVEVIGSDFARNMFDVTQNMQVFHVVMYTNSTVSSFSFSLTSKEMVFSVTGPSNTQGADIVTVPKPLLNSTLVVLMDNVAINNYFSDVNALPENETCCFTYFNYTQSTHSIKIRLTVLGDITGDRKVDVKDVALASSAYGSTPGSAEWEPLADIDKNYKIDVRDIALIASSYGEQL